jgi:hypothetical protein
MSTHATRWLALVAMGLATVPASAQVAGTFTGEIALGYFLAGDNLGSTHPIDPAGYLSLRDVGPAPSLGIAVVLPSTLGGLRPFARLSYARAAGVPAVWVPCDPGQACPSILIEPTVRASRVHGTVGLETPFLQVGTSVALGAAAAVGVRRYGISWEPWGGPPDNVFHLPRGSRGEWDALGEVGLEVSVSVGSAVLVGRWSIAVSEFGPGELTDLQTGGAVDLGRHRTTDTALHVGLRRGLF